MDPLTITLIVGVCIWSVLGAVAGGTILEHDGFQARNIGKKILFVFACGPFFWVGGIIIGTMMLFMLMLEAINK